VDAGQVDLPAPHRARFVGPWFWPLRRLIAEALEREADRWVVLLAGGLLLLLTAVNVIAP
jgi:hypothetical protein